MRNFKSHIRIVIGSLLALLLSSCATHGDYGDNNGVFSSYTPDYSSRVPSHISTGGTKTVLVDPNVHTWAAYGADGNLVRAGVATAGGNWCEDTGRPCRTSVGTFRIHSLGSAECKSNKYPIPNGGGLMPYCMFFTGSQALHGSPDDAVVDDNVSHGCVRMRIPDAEWLRYNFASVGTKVVVKAY